ncbi:MAG TPA: secondary thiamine-phosphate synthase enzyme YjbQ [Tepidisphaeraceae bacterium]|jgi:secondary thiamine-phosphate synthase enzyme|nr:secondary thiamine-phosphate synthase enzyme YjbQ [Tepidisphaeraceae bacterium]
MPSTFLDTQTVTTSSRNQMIEVTDRLRKLLAKHKIVDGTMIVYVPHTTAAVTINENADPDVKHDMLLKLSAMIPKHEPGYQHSEGNSDSHVKTALVGNSVTVLIDQGRLLLGRWQGVYFCEFDGPREREMIVKVASFTE